MSSLRSESLHVGVVGESATVAGVRSAVEGSVTVDTLPAAAVREGAIAERTDCLLVDDGSVDGAAVTAAATEARPVVVLVDGYDRTTAALAAGAAEALPRRLVDDDPDLLAARLVSVVDRDRERIRAEEREKYSTLVEQSSDGVVVVQDGQFTFVNERFTEITGYDRETLLDHPFHEVFSSESAELVRERHRRRVAGESPPDRYDVRIETADGDVRTLDLMVSRIQHEGEPATMANFRDVTERERQERAIRGLQDATERLQATDTAAGVAETAVDAAGEVLGAAAACWFRGAPTPAAATDAASARGLDRRLSADAAERAVGDDVTADAPGDGLPSDCLLLPLGEHGLLAALPDERAYGPATLDVARTLAEATTTALDRVERAREVRESERRLRLIADRIDQLIFLTDPEFSEVFYVNEAYEEITGRPVDDLDGKPMGICEQVHESDREGFVAAVESMIADLTEPELDAQDRYEFEWRLRRPDGDVRWLRGRSYPVRAGEEAVTGAASEPRLVTVVEDVTERKRREHEYEQIFDGVNDAISIHDPESGEMVDANESLCDLLGYDKAELLERGADGISVESDGFTGERGKELIRSVVDSGESIQVEWKVETSDGEVRWLESSGTRAVIGGETRYLAIDRDITERKRREREYEQIFNGVTDVINVYDPETKELVAVNDRMCELTGYDRETLVGRGIGAVSATDEGYTAERAAAIIDEVVAAGEAQELEWGLETADGEVRWLDVTATPTTINGEEHLLTISRDVTERRRTERRLRAILDRIDEAVFLAPIDELDRASPDPDYLSSGYEEIWGQPLDNLHERYEDGFFGTLHQDDEAGYRRFVEGIRRDVETGEAADRYAREYRIERPDGEVRWVHSDFYPTEWADGPPRIVIVSRDITERKERERRMASFNAATEDLTTADRPAAAARIAVEAATETLDLATVGAFLYDDDEGVLRPEVVDGRVPDALRNRVVTPDGGPLWESFATGTVVTPSEAGSDPADLSDWRALALGNHGVLLVGAPDSSLAPDTIQAAHVLAATLEAALNHLRGQRRLAVQEERLRTQTARAERLDRIARLTQQVETAITDASDAAEVEHAVCDRLAGTGPYERAWIGGVEVGADRLTPRVVVGASTASVEAADLTTTAADPDLHPAVRAWRTEDVQAVDSLVADGATGDWRRHALAAGVQSICAVPLTYDGITHGVLTVAASEPNAFGDRSRDVLDQLGTSVGYALAAIERRRALESDETVELVFRGEDADAHVDLPFVRAAREAGCRVRHERTVARDGGVSVFFTFEGEAADAAAVAARTLPGEVSVVTDDPDSTLVESRTDTWFGSPLAEYGAILRRAAATPTETTIAVEVSAQADVRSFTDRLRELAPTLDLVAKRQHQRQERTPRELRNRVIERLTDRQHEALTTALDAGYFEWPRENDGRDVAERLGITQPTLNKHLRLAERKTFELLFDSDDA
ncbi:MAG: PAS domain S-box protein [Haloplanus sp.]